VRALHKLENAEDGLSLKRINILREVHRITQLQIEWQRGFFNYENLYRSAFIYGGELAKAAFLVRNGFSLEQFTLTCFALRALWLDKPVIRETIDLSDIGIDRNISQAVLRHISLMHEDARMEVYKVRERKHHTSYRRSILRKYPAIGFEGNIRQYFAPIADLVSLRSSIGMFYDFAGSSDQVKNDISKRFETYCYSLIDNAMPGASTTYSAKYNIGKNVVDTPDVLLALGGTTSVIVECKATRMSYEARYGEDPISDARKGYEEIAKGVFQIWRFVSHRRRKLFTDKYSYNEQFGVVLTLDNWLAMAGDMQRDVIEIARKIASARDPDISEADQIGIIFCAINDLEITLQHSSEKSFLATLRAATQDRYREYHLWSVDRELRGETIICNPYPFRDRIGEVLPWWDMFGRD
jgi:hypothetical protein